MSEHSFSNNYRYHIELLLSIKFLVYAYVLSS